MRAKKKKETRKGEGDTEKGVKEMGDLRKPTMINRDQSLPGNKIKN